MISVLTKNNRDYDFCHNRAGLSADKIQNAITLIEAVITVLLIKLHIRLLLWKYGSIFYHDVRLWWAEICKPRVR